DVKRQSTVLSTLPSFSFPRDFRRPSHYRVADCVCPEARARGISRAGCLSSAFALRPRRVTRAVAGRPLAYFLFGSLPQRPHVALEGAMGARCLAEPAALCRALLLDVVAWRAPGPFGCRRFQSSRRRGLYRRSARLAGRIGPQ